MNLTEMTEETQSPAGAGSQEQQTAGTEPAAHSHDHAHDHDHEHTHDHGPALNPELTREIAVEVPADEVSQTYKKLTKRYQKLARIPGFRAGKVPESLIRSKFAKELRQEVLEALVSERFRKEIEERKLRPISEPQLMDLQLTDGSPLRFKAAFEVLPEVDISGYDSAKIQRPNVELSEDEYQSELNRVLESHATVEPVEEDRPLTQGDWADIQYSGEVKPLAQTVTEDGASAEKGEPITGQDVLIEIGGKNTIEAFTEALRGKKPGDQLSVEVEYPADFSDKRLAGQAVNYDVTVKAIKKKTFPERDAELARQLGGAESWEEFEKQLRENLARRKREALESQAKNTLIEGLIDKFQFPVPESVVQQRIDARLERGLRALAQQGMKPEDMRKMDFGRLRAAQRGEAEREVKASLIVDKIAEAEKVEVTDQELDNEVLMLSLQTREPYETLRERLNRDGGIHRLRDEMRREKTGTVLYEKLAS